MLQAALNSFAGDPQDCLLGANDVRIPVGEHAVSADARDDVVVVWALYQLFKPANESLSLVTAWFRIVCTDFLGVAVIFFQALQLLDHFGTGRWARRGVPLRRSNGADAQSRCDLAQLRRLARCFVPNRWCQSS